MKFGLTIQSCSNPTLSFPLLEIFYDELFPILTRQVRRRQVKSCILMARWGWRNLLTLVSPSVFFFMSVLSLFEAKI